MWLVATRLGSFLKVLLHTLFNHSNPRSRFNHLITTFNHLITTTLGLDV